LFCIDEKFEKLGLFDEKTGDFIPSKINVSLWATSKPQWRNIIITVTEKPGWSPTHTVEYFVDGLLGDKVSNIHTVTNIKYIGNSADGKEPIGIFADFRVYPFVMTVPEIQHLAHNSTSYTLPDHYYDSFKEHNFFRKILKKLGEDLIDMQIEICKVVAALATKKSCRLELIQNEAHECLIKLINHQDDNLRHYSWLALSNLT